LLRTAPTPQQALDRMLTDGQRRAATIGGHDEDLWAALTEAVSGSQHPVQALVLATHDGLGGQEPASAAVVAAAVDLLHTALVTHDDVLDGRDVRGGRLNVSGSFRVLASGAGIASEGAQALGRSAGILVGNLALTSSIRALATVAAPAETVRRLLDLADQALHRAVAGELGDVRLTVTGGSPSIADVLILAEQKSGASLFELPLQAGAVMAGADDAVVERLGEAGRLLGVAIRLRDDLRGVFGDPAGAATDTLTDPRAVARSAVLTHARTTGIWSQIEPCLGRSDLTPSEAAGVRALLVESGAKRYVEALADGYAAAAAVVFEELDLFSVFVLSIAGAAGPGADHAV